MAIAMYNTSMEKYRIQCCSQVFTFEPRAVTEVPDAFVTYLYKDYKKNGIFPIYPSDTPEMLKIKSKEALLAYRDGVLRERITNYYSQADEFKKRGITLEENKHFKTAKRWNSEIMQFLNIEEPIDEELSFLTDEQRKQTGEEKKLVFMDQNISDPKKIKAAVKATTAQERAAVALRHAEDNAKALIKKQQSVIDEILTGETDAPVVEKKSKKEA